MTRGALSIGVGLADRCKDRVGSGNADQLARYAGGTIIAFTCVLQRAFLCWPIATRARKAGMQTLVHAKRQTAPF